MVLKEKSTPPDEQDTYARKWAEHGFFFVCEYETLSQLCSVLAQKAESQRPKREYWVHEYENRNRAARYPKGNPRRIRPLATERSKTTHDRKANCSLQDKYTIVDALPSPEGKRCAYLYIAQRSSLFPNARPPAIHLKRRGRLTRRGNAGQPLTSTIVAAERRWCGRCCTSRSGRGWRRSPIARSLRNRYRLTSCFSTPAAVSLSLRFHRISRGDTSPACGRTTTLRRIALLDATSQKITKIVDLNPEFAFLRKSAAERMEGTNRFGENWYAYLVNPLDHRPSAGNRRSFVTTYRSGDYFLRGASGDESPNQVVRGERICSAQFRCRMAARLRRGDFATKLLDWASPTASTSRTPCRDWWMPGSSILLAWG